MHGNVCIWPVHTLAVTIALILSYVPEIWCCFAMWLPKKERNKLQHESRMWMRVCIGVFLHEQSAESVLYILFLVYCRLFIHFNKLFTWSARTEIKNVHLNFECSQSRNTHNRYANWIVLEFFLFCSLFRCRTKIASQLNFKFTHVICTWTRCVCTVPFFLSLSRSVQNQFSSVIHDFTFTNNTSISVCYSTLKLLHHFH